MAEETQYLGNTPVEGEGYLEPDNYRVRCKCLRCGHRYSKMYKAVPKDNPPCPKKACKAAIAAERAAKEAQHVEQMIETGETPGHVGANVRVKAIDATAEIVMQDYGMSDLKDNTRQGDSMVPNLSPRQRKMSENFWGGGKMSDRKRSPTYLPGVQHKMRGVVDSAMKGNYLPNVAATAGAGARTGDTLLRQIHGARYKPPVNIIYDANKPPKR